MSIHSYALWAKGPDPELTQCGEFVIEEAENLQIRRVAFRYTDNYLAEPWAYPLDPGKLPLSVGTFNFDATGKNLPGFIDDLKQLFAQMLFNEHLNNRDDHLRNFSFLNGPQGFRLAPAYDVVPSHVAGAYSALGYKGGSRLPDCDRAADAARAFHLTRNEAIRIAQAVREVVSHWCDAMRAFGIEERDLRTLAHALGESL